MWANRLVVAVMALTSYFDLKNSGRG